MTLSTIVEQQCRWADQHHIERRGHVCPSIEANLFKALNAATRAEIAAGSGDELGLSGRTPKLSSLRSSTAPVCNVFDAWRGTALAHLAASLNVPGDPLEFHFEQRLPHGLGSSPPHLDLVFFSTAGQPVGIESKFCEPYGATKDLSPIDAKYFVNHVERWSAFGLNRCQDLAERIGKTVTFNRLGADQLLKHALGLARVFGVKEPIKLLYLWFDSGCTEATGHRAEIERFKAHIGNEICFSDMTYQDLFARLSNGPEPASGYHDYLAARYFST